MANPPLTNLACVKLALYIDGCTGKCPEIPIPLFLRNLKDLFVDGCIAAVNADLVLLEKTKLMIGILRIPKWGFFCRKISLNCLLNKEITGKCELDFP